MNRLYYPRRMRQIMANPTNRYSYKAYMAVKKSQLEEVTQLVEDMDKAVGEAVDDMSKLNEKAEGVRKKIVALEDKGSEAVAEVKKLEKAKEKLDSINQEAAKTWKDHVDEIYDLWYGIKEYSEVVARTERNTHRMIELNLRVPGKHEAALGYFYASTVKTSFDGFKRQFEELVNSGFLGPLVYDAERLIGEKAVVEDMKTIRDMIQEAREKFVELTKIENQKYGTADVDKIRKRAAKRIESAKTLVREFAEVALYVNQMKVSDYKKELKAAYEAANKKIELAIKALQEKALQRAVSMSTAPMIDKLKEVADDLYGAHYSINQQSSKQNRLTVAEDFDNRKNSVVAKLEGIKKEVLRIRSIPLPVTSMQNAIENFEPFWQKVQSEFEKYSKDYPEVFQAAPRDILLLSKYIGNPPRYSGITNEEDVEALIYDPYIAWFDDMIEIAEEWIEFAEMFIGVKSVFRRKAAFRSAYAFGGKDPQYIKYVDALQSMLSDVLSGKSLSAVEVELLGKAARYYPNSPKIQHAYRTHAINRYRRYV